MSEAWKWCDCDYVNAIPGPDVAGAKISGGLVPCGCGKHDIHLYRVSAIHFCGQHWNIGCAFSAVLAQAKEGKNE